MDRRTRRASLTALVLSGWAVPRLGARTGLPHALRGCSVVSLRLRAVPLSMWLI
ncbi:hypothetical protein HMPREF1556_01260 [Porphyromonas sp. oral taxon 278 str. W7784]|nr:hypothetical protein HMPREF1556_01260 [Porphyromonas sp. oral taxon 278 str. W7784]